MNLPLFWIQVKDLTVASLKSRYRKTWAGFVWVILNPLLMFGVQSLVFKRFLGLQIPDYYLFLLGGLLPWIFMSSTIQMGTPIFVTQAQLLRSFKINPMVLLAAQVLDNFLNFLTSFFLILIPFYVASDRSLSLLLLLPIALLPLLIGTLAITISLAVLNVFYRDINFVMGFVFSLMFFLTPIFYSREYIPQQFQFMVDYNPLVYFIAPFHSLIYDNSVGGFFLDLILGMGMAILFVVLALVVWKRKQNAFYYKL